MLSEDQTPISICIRLLVGLREKSGLSMIINLPKVKQSHEIVMKIVIPHQKLLHKQQECPRKLRKLNHDFY